MKIEKIVVDMSKIYQFFETAKKEIKYENRFKNAKLDKLVEFLFFGEVNKRYLKKGSTYHRARIYTDVDAEKRYLSNEKNVFQGYDKDNSFINAKRDFVSAGRCNPQWIPYLYMSDSIECCIHEIRPAINSYISVATILVNQPIKILDLSTDTIALMKHDNSKEILPSIPNGVLAQYLSGLFSTPYQIDADYLITQYISEKIKEHYDGIAYKSSIYDGESNTNYVIFDYDKCEAISSKLYKVKSVKIECETNKKE